MAWAVAGSCRFFRETSSAAHLATSRIRVQLTGPDAVGHKSTRVPDLGGGDEENSLVARGRWGGQMICQG